MRFVFFISLLCIGLLGCKSSHKLTGTDYVDISTNPLVSENIHFPSEIADSLGWEDLSSNTGAKVKEEFRIALNSEYEPFHVYRLKKRKRKIEGESILYWSKKGDFDAANPHTNMRQYLKKRCSEFFETANFEYCIPGLLFEPDWKRIYATLENNNIWQIPDQSELNIQTEPDSNAWAMNIQVRLQNYYRSYTHISPDQYSGSLSRIDLMGIAGQLQLINTTHAEADNFNSFTGITKGTENSSFLICDESEEWRFNADLAELATISGMPMEIEPGENSFFYISVSGTVEDEWYGNRDNSGFTRVISPTEVHQILLVSSFKCPSK